MTVGLAVVVASRDLPCPLTRYLVFPDAILGVEDAANFGGIGQHLTPRTVGSKGRPVCLRTIDPSSIQPYSFSHTVVHRLLESTARIRAAYVTELVARR